MEGLVWRPNFYEDIAVLSIAHLHEEEGKEAKWDHMPILWIPMDQFIEKHDSLVADLGLCRDIILEGKRLLAEGMSMFDLYIQLPRLIDGDGFAVNKTEIPEDFLKAFEGDDEPSVS